MGQEFNSETYESYAARMRKLYQFRSPYGDHNKPIDPLWQPGEKDIAGFCHDEVVRQGHDPRIFDDGGIRIKNMLAAWEHARRNADRYPTVDDIQIMGFMIEPDYNVLDRFRVENVYIGGRKAPGAALVRGMVDDLVEAVPVAWRTVGEGHTMEWRAGYATFRHVVQNEVHNADDWYLMFEWIHPFADGNGRTGKILHNWLLGTLDDPVLVRDYFGMGNP